MDSPVLGRFQLHSLLGQGAFGEVRLAVDSFTHEKFAIKLERKSTKYPQLLHEADIIKSLQGKGIPKLISVGENDTCRYIVVELLGENLANYAKRRLDTMQIVDVVKQCISRVEYVHSRSYLHNDIKPHNFCIGPDHRTVFLTDFGLSQLYEDSATRQHVAYRENVPFIGTLSYASLNVHMGVHPSRRDDLESVILIAIRLFKGKLPWEKLGVKSKMRKQGIVRGLKLGLTVEELCVGLPPQLRRAFRYVRELKFYQKPDYDYLRSLFSDIQSHPASDPMDFSPSDPVFLRCSSLKRTHTSHECSHRFDPALMRTYTATIRKRARSQKSKKIGKLPRQPSLFDDSPCEEDTASEIEVTVKQTALPEMRMEIRARWADRFK